MHLHAYCLLIGTLAVSASALQFPIKRFQNSPGAGLSRRADGDNSTLSLQTAHDLIYIVNITVQETEYPVQLDSGSSDLWIMADSYPIAGTTTTDLTANLTFGIGWVAGNVGYGSAQFADIPVSKQAFLDVSSANNPALGYGAKGLMGLGFTSLSNIDSLVNGTGSSEGRSLLYNLFQEHKDEPNFISFVLLRDSEYADEMDGSFTLGEYVEEYKDVVNSKKISTFPVNSPSRWNVLLDAAIIGDNVFYPTTTVNGAPINKAVALLDSGTSYSYVSAEFAEAVYGSVPGSYLDSGLGQWIIPCDAEIDMALQFSGQIVPIHPLDVTPKSLTNSSECVGSFVPQSVGVGEGAFDMLLGDNFLRAVYSVYDFGDFDSSGQMGNPYVQLLNLVDPDAASKEFADSRGTTAKTGIVYNAADSSISPVIMSGGLETSLNNLETLLPAVLGIVALNAVVMLALLVLGIWWMCFKGRASKSQARGTNARMNNMPLTARNSYIAGGDVEEHRYEPVSMAITEDTLASPTSYRHKFDDNSKNLNRPMSLATLPSQAYSARGSEDQPLTPLSASFQGVRPMSVGVFPQSSNLNATPMQPLPAVIEQATNGQQPPEDRPFTPPSSTGTLHKAQGSIHSIRSTQEPRMPSPLAGPPRRPSYPPPAAPEGALLSSTSPPSPTQQSNVPAIGSTLRPGALRPGVSLSDRPMSAMEPSMQGSGDFAPPRPAFRAAGSSSDRPRSMA